jgi:hypothetical protein
MKLFARGLLTAAVALCAVMFGASSALAGPIGGPYLASGQISLDGGLGGTTCDSTIQGVSNDDAVDSITFTNCVGLGGTPRANNLPWAISWSGSTGTVAIDATSVVLGVTCRYQGTLTITVTRRAVPPPTWLIVIRGTARLISGSFPCPTSVAVDALYTM